jgi:hypothetical protein
MVEPNTQAVTGCAVLVIQVAQELEDCMDALARAEETWDKYRHAAANNHQHPSHSHNHPAAGANEYVRLAT